MSKPSPSRQAGHDNARTADALGAMRQLLPGHARELGAKVEDDRINFALAAPNAEAVELCVFDAAGKREIARLSVPGRSQGIWHGALPRGPGVGEGLVYGWRVHGPWAPQDGHRFNPAKLLLDPCARDVVGHYDGADIHLGHRPDDATATIPDSRDNAAVALKGRVVADLPPLAVPRPAIDPAQRVLYELHVKGFTAQHPDIPPALRGTYAGLGHPVAVEYLRALGVTTISLLPVAFRADEERLLAMGLHNYWGYNPIAWSAPEARYGSGTQGGSTRAELRAMIDAMHAAGIEVVLDVVYNHTAEGNAQGPTLSMRGIDNALYYHLQPDDRASYVNWSGCGNSVNLDEPLVLRTVLDSLRRWVREYGVDGFRFDLAPILARGGAQVQGAFMPHAPLLGAMAQDPVLRDRLFIAEPWDLGYGGYQLGGFPPGWLEWNDRFRDTQRAFWLQHKGSRGALAAGLAGSSDVFDPRKRDAHSSVNFITAHDGFTLRDLVSYAQRHNQANGEDNRDGHSHNLSTNNGVEGETRRRDVLQARTRQRRALLTMLLLSLGTPMLLAGDEFGQTQRGNNNAYCQDNPIAWLDWRHADTGLRDFVRRLIALRRNCRLLQSAAWWHREPLHGGAGPVAQWLKPDGEPMTIPEWDQGGAGRLMLHLSEPSGVSAVLMLVNADAEQVEFLVPQGRWLLNLDSAADTDHETGVPRRVLAPRETLGPSTVWVARLEVQAQRDV